ncbi:MAG: outer membrane protein transport protein [Deltaproteobacteria bacterium]|nr:outer membrane protein transport protein [Deltaproteobacteria bacterium]
MKLGKLVVGVSLLASTAHAGGLFLPGSGATSTSRAGAAVASADDGEALSINPAGLAKTKGTTITISTTFIRYFMEFTRRGTYDATPDAAPYEGTDYPTIENDPKPPLGVAKFQPIPVVAVVTDLGGRLTDARLAIGLYAPQGYPFRDMTAGYKFPVAGDPDADLESAPPPSRYDILTQESRLLLPTIAAAYRLSPKLDIGARFTAGSLQSKSVVAVWGTPFNVGESVRNDSLFTAEVKDGFIPAFGFGLAYRPSPNLEIGFNYSSAIVVKAKGTASSVKGPGVSADRVIGPLPDEMTSCATGGTFEQQKACINLQLPRSATIGLRYKVLDAFHREKGDVEFNVAWENWGKKCELRGLDEEIDPGQFEDPGCTSPGQYKVVIDSGLYTNGNFAQPLEKNYVNYGLKDVYSFRLGGSYHLLRSAPTIDPMSPNSGPPFDGPPPRGEEIIVRGGIAYDTAAAETGWLRSNFDGAARVTTTVGAAFRTRRFEINLGGGFVYEGTNTNPGAKADGSDCNPTLAAGNLGCRAAGDPGSGQDRPINERQGPDPTNPLLQPPFQTENPYNQGSYKSHYLLFMLGFSTWF